MKSKCIYLLLLVSLACKMQSGSDAEQYDPTKTFRFRLNPADNAIYQYEVSSESEIEMEIDNKEITTSNNTEAAVTYTIVKDSSGDFVFHIKYDRISIRSRSGDNETVASVSQGSIPLTPIEKMLYVLKDANLTGRVSTAGQLKHLEGYDEIGQKIIAQFDENDVVGRKTALAQWERKAGNNLVRNNIQQLFQLFPDSAVRVGDSWNLASKQVSEFSINLINTFTLKAINKEIALITATGKISNNNTSEEIPGYGQITTSFEGDQESRFELEAQTGMLLNCESKAKAKGNVNIMGREVPVKIKNSIVIKGKRK